ncbi:MAG: phosphoribosylformylglycinamidine synthase subunit PurS [Pseudobdellovibrionaceae bacterium]|nr:phosphoribosylformylglycinamidine synthase subunit PurS [Bdellovibrionales bacterium]USN48344.1 MAG: phosphoribosylformylglycinamidine synthase subunit PurS [Pseudobdellovibrionaceae bacterium]
MRIGVKILPRNEVLDSQGRAVERTLAHHGKSLESVRVGKYVQLDIDAPTEEAALEKAKEVAEFVLYNPLIESYELEVLS